ncbi:MAG: amidohydrolase family protein [Myxococcota bacterium]
MGAPQTTLLRGGTLVTMDGERRVLRADLRMEQGRIEAIGKLRKRAGDTVVDASDMLVLPGLIQTHVHLCQALFRNLADDLPLLDWLKERIWPFEGAHDASSMRASAELGLAEMMTAGTTTILDMGSVHHQDAVFRAMAKSGIRGASGKAMMDAGSEVPKTLRESTRASLRESNALADRWHDKGRLRYAYAPRFILSCTERLWREVAEIAPARGCMIHSHAAEHAEERAAVKALLGQDDIAALRSYGIHGAHVALAHGVQLRKGEMKRLGKDGTRIVHCPSANLKLASGIADVVAMRKLGMVVGLGADGAPCNNRLDPWTELRSAALLAKGKRLDASALPAREALELLTTSGAKLLSMEDKIGSLEVGKFADVIAVDRDGLHQLPGDDPYSQLVYATTASDVRHVFVQGEWIVQNRVHRHLDAARVRARAKGALKKLLARL